MRHSSWLYRSESPLLTAQTLFQHLGEPDSRLSQLLLDNRSHLFEIIVSEVGSGQILWSRTVTLVDDSFSDEVALECPRRSFPVIQCVALALVIPT